MGKREKSISELKQEEDWIAYLEKNSGLPGKRANLELMFAIMELGDEEFFNKCLLFDEQIAPTNTPGEFIAMCGTAGLGKLISEGKSEYWIKLKKLASDPRWRVREAAAFALQRIGRDNFLSLIEHLSNWKTGNYYEKRAVVAGLCEPILLEDKNQAETVLKLIHEIILSIKLIEEQKNESFRVLKKGLGYGLSVALVACPEKGKEIFEKLVDENDPGIQWILKENLRKNRLMRMDPQWTKAMTDVLSKGSNYLQS